MLPKCIFIIYFIIAGCYSTYHPTSNPSIIEVNDVHLFGHSGEMIDNMMRFTKYDNVCDLMEQTLYWRHSMPSVADSLGCYPFYDNDPFIFSEIPHIYFVGNQKEFKSKIIEFNSSKILLLSIPKFNETKTAVLVNIKNFNCTTIKLED